MYESIHNGTTQQYKITLALLRIVFCVDQSYLMFFSVGTI